MVVKGCCFCQPVVLVVVSLIAILFIGTSKSTMQCIHWTGTQANSMFMFTNSKDCSATTKGCITIQQFLLGHKDSMWIRQCAPESLTSNFFCFVFFFISFYILFYSNSACFEGCNWLQPEELGLPNYLYKEYDYSFHTNRS